MKLTYQTAELAMQQYDYAKAQESYALLMKMRVEDFIDEWTYADMVLQLVTAEEKLDHLPAARNLLEDLIKRKLSDDWKKIAYLRLARLHSSLGQPGDSYQTLIHLEEAISRREWSPEDRAFASALEFTLNSQYSKLVKRADRLSQSGLYAEACNLYREVYTGIKNGYYPEAMHNLEYALTLIYKLAETHSHLQEHQEVVQLLTHLQRHLISRGGGNAAAKRVEQQALYLFALAEKTLGHYEKAIATFLTYLHLEWDVIPFEPQVRWELGECYYLLKKYEEAREQFSLLSHSTTQEQLNRRARIYLAKIDLLCNRDELAEKALFSLSTTLSDGDPLKAETSFLLGQIAYKKQDSLAATRLFDEALSCSSPVLEWHTEALYKLGCSYLDLVDRFPQEAHAHPTFLDRAEQAFKELISWNKSESVYPDSASAEPVYTESAYLGLAKVYLRQSSVLNDPQAKERVETLLSRPALFSSPENRAEALLLRAEACQDPKQEERFYQQLTKEPFLETPSYGEGCYRYGLLTFKQGSFEIAAQVFGRAYEAWKSQSPKRARLARKQQAHSYFNQVAKEAKKVTLEICEELLQDAQENDLDELLYLEGLCASSMFQETGVDLYRPIAEEKLKGLLLEFPDSSYVPKALYTLGTFYFRERRYVDAEKLFVRLAENYPDERSIDEAWFWAGEAAEQQNDSSNRARSYRKKVFEHFPRSPRASEAYFLCYSFADYLSGNVEAAHHLHLMPLRFPASPFLIVAHYLRGLELKQDHTQKEVGHANAYLPAIDSFRESILCFDKSFSRGDIATNKLVYFTNIRYRAMMELALTQLDYAEKEGKESQRTFRSDAIAGLVSIVKEFEERSPLSQHLLKQELYPPIYQEAEFTLAYAQLKNEESGSAQNTLQHVVDHCQQAHIHHGIYLSRAYEELGHLAMKNENFSTALKDFILAENSGKQTTLTNDQRLTLWIQQSLCYRALNQLNEAMLTLSKVIHDETAAQSHDNPLRAEALYRSAEIYELQGHSHLAIKQLESVRLLGGSWGLKAHEKLYRDYGVE
jgi:TolA-binding protein